MKIISLRLIFLSFFLASMLSLANAYAFDAIRQEYQEYLKQANEALAKNPAKQERAALLRKKAQALDTLDQHAQALDAINESIGINPTIEAALTKSIILRSIGDLQNADEPLANWMEANKGNAAAMATMSPLIGEIHFQRALLSIRRQKWEAAMSYAKQLVEVEHGGYGEVLARYIALRSGIALVASDMPKSDASPYRELCAMLDGKAPPAAFKVIEEADSPIVKAEAQSEIDFFTGVYLRYIVKNETAAVARFRKLAEMPWYGSAEQELAGFELGHGD